MMRITPFLCVMLVVLSIEATASHFLEDSSVKVRVPTVGTNITSFTTLSMIHLSPASSTKSAIPARVPSLRYVSASLASSVEPMRPLTTAVRVTSAFNNTESPALSGHDTMTLGGTLDRDVSPEHPVNGNLPTLKVSKTSYRHTKNEDTGQHYLSKVSTTQVKNTAERHERLILAKEVEKTTLLAKEVEKTTLLAVNETLTNSSSLPMPEQSKTIDSSTARQNDPNGAMLFIVLTLCLYGFSIVAFIAGHVKKRYTNKDEEKQIIRYVKQRRFSAGGDRPDLYYRVIRYKSMLLSGSAFGQRHNQRHNRHQSLVLKKCFVDCDPRHGLNQDGDSNQDNSAPSDLSFIDSTDRDRNFVQDKCPSYDRTPPVRAFKGIFASRTSLSTWQSPTPTIPETDHALQGNNLVLEDG